MFRRILATAVAIATTSANAGINPDSLRPLAAQDWDEAAAAHLLRRTSFGGTPTQAERLASMSVEQAVASLVDYEQIRYEPAPPQIDDVLFQPVDRQQLRGLSEDERRKLQLERQQAERRAIEEIRLWWVERMVESPRPFEEVMTLFWHGHFTSGYREVRRPLLMLEQNEFLRRHAQANFSDLVHGISRDRAMLVYLDGVRNNKKKPNENYGRELMELFTLGVGNYTENDVKAAARAFTGWGFDREGFRFSPRNHDYGVKKFLGRTGRFNGDDIVDIIIQQPACAQYLARKLLEKFVRPDPSRKLVAALSGVIRRNKFELKPTMKTLLASQAFYHPSARGSLVKSPVELVVGTARTLGVRINDLRAAERAMALMGQELLQPPNVKGWDGGKAWINTATLFYRYNTVTGLVFGTGRAPRPRPREAATKTNSPADSRMMQMMFTQQLPRARRNSDPQPPFDAIGTIRSARLSDAREIVDFFCDRLLAVPLSGAKRDQLVAYLDGGGRFNLRDRKAADRLRMLVTLICSTPEYQMY